MRDGKKEVLQISIEDVSDLHKDLLADLSSTLDSKISVVVNSQGAGATLGSERNEA